LADAAVIRRLAERAAALGATRVAPLPAARVVVDERVTLKCRVPLCSSWGRNLMCPPNVPTPDEMRRVLAGYTDALLVQADMPLDGEEATARLGGRPYAEACDAGALPEVLAAQRAFAGLMTDLEREAFALGCRWAAAFAGGECVLCDECVGQGSGLPCRHPFAARPSMEAVGIDVVATAAAAGLTVAFPAQRPSWTGLLLVD